MGGVDSRWRRAGKQIGSLCSSCFYPLPQIIPRIISTSAAENGPKSPDDAEQNGLTTTNKSLCAICLDPLSCNGTTADGPPVMFTAECNHTFHFTCIASNVRYGSITCPICRAPWSHLPRQHHHFTSAQSTTNADPVLQILEDSIATSRVNRRFSLRSTRLYDDDDPVDPLPSLNTTSPRLCLALVPTVAPYRAYLSVKLAHQTPTDLVLVVSPNGPHLRLLKQAILLAVFTLSSSDRLAIVTCSASGATRAFPLRRMTPHGKRSALRVIGRIFYLGPSADSSQGIRKGLKILEDRSHQNPNHSILQLSDSPAERFREPQFSVPVPIHRFHVGFGFGASNGFVMHEFQEFLGRLMGGVIRETKVRVGYEGEWVRLGEVRGGEERRIAIDSKEDCEFVCVGYGYVEGSSDNEELVTGEMVVGFEEKGERCGDGGREVGGGERMGCVERRDYLDPFMARRWAKHLHRA